MSEKTQEIDPNSLYFVLDDDGHVVPVSEISEKKAKDELCRLMDIVCVMDEKMQEIALMVESWRNGEK